MAWTFERYLVHPSVDPYQPPILVGFGGSPNGVQVAPKGSLACRRDGTTADLLWYLNTDGSSTWVVAFKPLALAWYSGTVTSPAADSASGVDATGDDSVQVWPGPFTSPAVPRNVTITFGSAWAGGDVTVTGTDQFDAALTEVITASAGAKVEGLAAFKTVTGISHAAAGAGGLNHGATAGWGHVFGVTKALGLALGVLTEDGANDAALWNATYSTFSPTQLPDGSRTYRWAVPT